MALMLKIGTLNDLDLVNQLLRLSKAHWGYDQLFMDKFMKELCVKPYHLEAGLTTLVFKDNKLIGFYAFILCDDNALELDYFFLHLDHIGGGLGQEMWDACCQTAKAFGKNEFIIWVDPNAENFYLRMGCKKIGVRKSSMMPNRFPSILEFKIKRE